MTEEDWSEFAGGREMASSILPRKMQASVSFSGKKNSFNLVYNPTKMSNFSISTSSNSARVEDDFVSFGFFDSFLSFCTVVLLNSPGVERTETSPCTCALGGTATFLPHLTGGW